MYVNTCDKVYKKGSGVSIRSFILIEVTVGKVDEVRKSLSSNPEVKSANVVTGSYDIIALVEAEDMKSVAELVTIHIQSIQGVTKTITCVAM